MRTQHLKFALKKTLVVLLSSLIKKNKKLDSGKYSLYHLPLRYFTSTLLCVTLTVINRFLKLLSRTTKLVEESLTCCGFELELLSEQVQRLRHKVVVTGVSSLTTFTIRYPQEQLLTAQGECVY